MGFVDVFKVFEFLTTDIGAAEKREGAIAVFADDIGVDTARIDFKHFAEMKTETGSVKDCTGAEDLAFREVGDLIGAIGHGVAGVRDDDDDSSRSGGNDSRDDVFDDGEVGVGEFETGFAGFLGGAGGDDDDVTVYEVRVVVGGEDSSWLEEGHAVFKVEFFTDDFTFISTVEDDFIGDASEKEGVGAG